MSNIIKTVEKFNPLLKAVNEYYKEEDKEEDIVKENYKNDEFSIVGGIISIVILVAVIYLWIGIHYNRKENFMYKFFSFIISISSSIFYLLGNYIFNDNTTEILKQFPKFPPRVDKNNYNVYYNEMI
jgi:hypothetical protein